MDEIPADPWLGGVIGTLWLASAATWIILVSRWRRRGEILEYEPRSPVPWGAPVALFAVLYVAVSVWSGIGADAAQGAGDELDPSTVIQQLSGFIVFQSLMTGGLLFVVAVIYRAGRRDFGLPASANELVRDVGIGIVAWLASIAPVHGLQTLFLYLLGTHESSHPLVKMVTSGEPNVALLLLASVVAVVVAPLSEEVLFRLLLQGWLEKWEDRGTHLREETPYDEAQIANGENDVAIDSPALIDPASAEDFEPTVDLRPRGRAGLPHGWAPILLSSLLFAMAHFGYGPDPIAIFFLSLILGYVYQRTHRILPCIVAHALFNSMAMLVLWRMVFSHAQ